MSDDGFDGASWGEAEATSYDDVYERYLGAWWRRVVKPALDKHPAVAAPEPGGSEWQFVGE